MRVSSMPRIAAISIIVTLLLIWVPTGLVFESLRRTYTKLMPLSDDPSPASEMNLKTPQRPTSRTSPAGWPTCIY